MKTNITGVLASHAQYRIENGANPDDLAHIVGEGKGDNAYVSTPLTQEEFAKGGYTSRYYTLAYIASGALDT